MAVALQSENEWRIPKMHLGRRMAWAREDAGISGQEMADLMGVSSGTISNWEKGTSQPRNLFETVEKWATFTRAPVGWLLTGDASAPTTTCSLVPSLTLVEFPPNDAMQLFDPDDFGLDVPHVTPVTTGA